MKLSNSFLIDRILKKELIMSNLNILIFLLLLKNDFKNHFGYC